jgi:hypothetical protein
VHEETEKGHKIDELSGLEFGDHLLDKERDEFRDGRADGIDEL